MIKKNKGKLPIAFLLCSFYALFLPVFFPPLRLTYFAPFLILLFYRASFQTCLWSSFLAGLFIDLLTTDTRFGLYALNYTLATAFLYHFKKLFFEDYASTVPCMTAFFCVISTCIQVVLLYAFNKKLIVSWDWVGTDLVAMPILDGLYALFGIMMPLSFMQKINRRSRRRKQF